MKLVLILLLSFMSCRPPQRQNNAMVTPTPVCGKELSPKLKEKLNSEVVQNFSELEVAAIEAAKPCK